MKKGDHVWTCTNSFVASASCALHCGAKIDLVDINSETYNLDVNSLSKKLKIARKKKATESCDTSSFCWFTM